MKILTVFGTRPEIIRLSRIISRIDEFPGVTQLLVNTKQNNAEVLNRQFIREFNIRNPNYELYNTATQDSPLSHRISDIFCQLEKIIEKEKPDKFLVLGDTNSALSIIIAKRMGIKTYHLEAGNRCFDDRVPEEINRRIIDSCSDVLMPYTQRSKENLIKEGFPLNRIYVTGNPIYEVMRHYLKSELNLDEELTEIQQLYKIKRPYVLVTLHRSENIDNPNRLFNFILIFNRIRVDHNIDIVISLHPHLAKNLGRNVPMEDRKKLVFIIPPNFGEFHSLVRHSVAVISDSGTVCEEMSIYEKHCITIRDVTERPETIECGSNILVGCDYEKISAAINVAKNMNSINQPPIEYKIPDVSSIVQKIVCGI